MLSSIFNLQWSLYAQIVCTDLCRMKIWVSKEILMPHFWGSKTQTFWYQTSWLNLVSSKVAMTTVIRCFSRSNLLAIHSESKGKHSKYFIHNLFRGLFYPYELVWITKLKVSVGLIILEACLSFNIWSKVLKFVKM